MPRHERHSVDVAHATTRAATRREPDRASAGLWPARLEIDELSSRERLPARAKCRSILACEANSYQIERLERTVLN